MFDFVAANAGEVAIISHYGNDATVERFFRRKTMAICTMDFCRDRGRSRIPLLRRLPKALRMAREMGIPLVEMVFRMATLPCRFLNLPDPVLRAGADASLVLFDAERVRERNDYLNPEVRPEGIDCVWVHGVCVLDEGRLVAPPRPFPGRALMSPART